MSDYKNLAWIDLETTGLRPDRDAILEIGIIITTKSLEETESQRFVVLPSKEVPLSEIDPFVLKMHSDSGLWKESFDSELSVYDGEELAAQFIESNDAKSSPACGSSIHFDRQFLKAQTSRLNEVFHYRNIDVSTVKNLMELYCIDLFESRPQPKKKHHRTIEDLRYSIAELKHYAMRQGWNLREA